MAIEQDFYDPVFTPFGAPVIATQPQGISTPSSEIMSAYEPIVFDLTWAGSSNAYITNIRMEATLYYGSTPVSLGTQKKKSILVSGTTTYRFDFSDMLKTVLNPEFWNNITSDVIQVGNENIVVPFYIDFVCKFVDDKGIERTDTTLTSSTYYAVNAIVRPTETQKVFNSSSDYVLDSTTSKFLSLAPSTRYIKEFENDQLSFIYVGSDDLQLKYSIYDLGGNLTSTLTKTPYDVTTEKNGTITVNNNGVSTLMTSFWSIASKIEVWVAEVTGSTQISEKITYIFDKKCSDGYRLKWHNSLGGVDAYTFDAYKNKTYEQESRMNYTKSLDVSSTVVPSDIRKQTFATSGNYTFTGITQLKSTDLEMFVDLINSTEVYWEQSQNSLVSVVIKSSSQTVEDSDGMIQVQIEFELSQGLKTHIA